MRNYFKKFLRKVAYYFEDITRLRFRLNMLICIYSLIFLTALSCYGYFNFIKLDEYKKNKEIETISSDLNKSVQIFDDLTAELTSITETIFNEYSASSKNFVAMEKGANYSNKLEDTIETIFKLDKEISGISIFDNKNNTVYSRSNSYSSYGFSDNSEDIVKELAQNVTKQRNLEPTLKYKTKINGDNYL